MRRSNLFTPQSNKGHTVLSFPLAQKEFILTTQVLQMSLRTQGTVYIFIMSQQTKAHIN